MMTGDGVDESGRKTPERPASRYALMLCLVVALSSFVFVRIYNRETVFIVLDGGDDAGYLAHTEALLRYHTWDWCAAPFTSRTLKEQCSSGLRPAYNKCAPGPALSVLPLNALGLVLEDTGLLRTRPLDPLVFWSLVGAFVLFGGAMLLLWRIAVLLGCSPRLAFWATTAMALGNPILYYVFRRPLMGHAAEFFWFSAATFFLLRYLHAATPRVRVMLAGFLGSSAAMLAVTRFNDAPIAAAFIAAVLTGDRARGPRARGFLFGLLGAAVPIALLAGEVWAQLRGAPLPPYDSPNHFVSVWPLTLAHLQRMAGFFIGVHWGIVLLTPFVAVELVVIAVRGRRLLPRVRHQKSVVVIFAVAGGVQLLLASSYWSVGASYGSRYAFAVYWLLHLAFLLSLGTASASDRARAPIWRHLCVTVAAAAVLVGALNLGSFESAPELTPRRSLVRDEGVANPEFGTLVDWVTPHFATRALKNALSGRAVLTFGASPIVGYPCLAARMLFGAAAHVPQALLDYYWKRGISSLADLGALFRYHLVVLTISAMAAACFWRAGRRADASKKTDG